MKVSKLFFPFTVLFIILLITSACKRDKEHEFPFVPVSFTINIYTDPAFIMLQAQGNSQVISYYDLGYSSLGYGNNGVIIYNAGGGEFYAFDATCPYDLPEINAVELSEISGIAVCPKCKSRYVFPSYGMPTIAGPAVYPMHEYNAYYNQNTGDLTIRN